MNAIVILLLCSSCSRKKTDTSKEFANINERTQKRLDETLYAEKRDPSYSPIFRALREKITRGFTSDDAAQLALIQNPHLRADFEHLGLAKADFEQAALYKNPTVDFSAKIPVNPHTETPEFVTQYDAHLVFSVSELWQIGARKKVAKDEIEIVSMRINHTILDTYVHTKKAYFECVSFKAQLDLAQEIVQTALTWKDRMYYRKEFGLVTDLDTHLADAQMGGYQLDVIAHNQALQTAYIKLRYVLGINITADPLSLIESFEYPATLPDVQLLIAWALADHPAMQIARLKVQQAEDRISYEKRRTIKDVTIGFAFERDFDRPIGPGVHFGMEIPVFDTNAVQIAHAYTELDKCKKELRLQEAIVLRDVLESYQVLTAAHQSIKKHDTIVDNYEKAMQFAQEQITTMMFDKIVMLQMQLSLYQAKKMRIAAYYNLTHAWIDVEKTVGRKIDSYQNS